MTVGAQRQAHAPSRAPEKAEKATSTRVDAVLAGPACETPQTVRLDLVDEFTSLGDAIRDVVGFAGAATLICEDFFEARLVRAEEAYSFTLTVSSEQIERMRWAFEHSETLARAARGALETLENLAAWEGIKIPVQRRPREAQS